MHVLSYVEVTRPVLAFGARFSVRLPSLPSTVRVIPLISIAGACAGLLHY